LTRRRGGSLGRSAARPAGRRRGNRVFYVVAEGQGTEYDYLNQLNLNFGSDLGFLIQRPAQNRGLSASQVVQKACETLDPDITVWAIFDHDGQADIDPVCARARRHGVSVALSHPAFELWLLLHFQDFPAAAQNGSNDVIMTRLRAAHPEFADYRRGSKRIDDARFAALREDSGILRAAARARRLTAECSHRAPSGQDPSTSVYLLIEALGITPEAQAQIGSQP
jgi:hypothetical protein